MTQLRPARATRASAATGADLQASVHQARYVGLWGALALISWFAEPAVGELAAADCSYYTNYNITTPTVNVTTAASAESCCAHCRLSAGCLAAVYADDGYCYMKAVSGAARKRSLGGTVCVPPAAPPTEIPITSAPVVTSLPPAATPSPTPPGETNVTIVRYTHCQYNAMCNPQIDNTCHTEGLVPDTCYSSADLNISYRVVCDPSQGMVTKYTYEFVSGCAVNSTSVYSSTYPVHQCIATSNSHFEEYRCDNTTTYGDSIVERQICDGSCTDGPCIDSSFRSGVCSGDVSTFPGATEGMWSVLPQCYSGNSGTFVAFFLYANTTMCDGDPITSTVDKSNECHPNMNEQWVNTICSPQ